MSSNTLCSSDGKLCTQAYPVKDYFLALFVIVICLVSLRMLLYASYYSWLRLSARRRQQGDEDGPPDFTTTYAAVRGPTTPAASTSEDERVCVIVAGEDRPTFIAQPAPLAPFRSIDSQVLSMKAMETTKI